MRKPLLHYILKEQRSRYDSTYTPSRYGDDMPDDPKPGIISRSLSFVESTKLYMLLVRKPYDRFKHRKKYKSGELQEIDDIVYEEKANK